MKRNILSITAFSLIVIFVAFSVNGCKEEESAQSNPTSQPKQDMDAHAGHDHTAMSEMKTTEAPTMKMDNHTGHDHDAADTTMAKMVMASVEQENCPVMGGKINKAVFTEYKGKKVYFCCAGCDKKFNADPAKYISKLPQFKE